MANCFKKNAIWVWILLAAAVVGIIVGLIYGLAPNNNEDDAYKPGVGAIASNGVDCANIGGNILRQGGSAVDAAIATLLCEGVLLPHSLGIGGGFIATIYTKHTGKIETLVARETAPAAATETMFVDKEITGALSAGVPTEIFGYWRLHERYGVLPWKTLFEPTIELCRKGHTVSKQLANVLQQHEERIRKEPSMAEIFINPADNQVYKEGDTMYRPRLGDTLEAIAVEGPQTIYGGGRIGRLLVDDIQSMGGIITEADLQTYEPRWEQPIVTNFSNGYTLHTSPLPSSGAVLSFILSVMEPWTAKDIGEEVYWHRVVETFKHAYGHRTNLGDIRFNPEVAEIYNQLLDPHFAAEIRALIKDDITFEDMAYYGANFTNVEDHGTANLAVLAQNGDAITITSTINSHLGAKVRSRRTGIILNDEMDDFSTPGVVNFYGIPASPANYIKPGKIPMSSTCPSIVLDKDGNLQLLIGGAGGAKITTSVAQTILRYFMLNQSTDESVHAGRVHHQLAPMAVDIEPDVPQSTRDYLLKVGHHLNYLLPDKAYSALTAIGLKSGKTEPVCDRRRPGSTILVT
ncbi:scoloptoxin SSD14-like [Teleopsis dalmanni]|uniref:scoloptoxin SSD14-like n=1 Tax=Teleopsis dalmanni TaxID=139649 RepID=UPI0018CDB205|nr:scoloptoxin SSD14-like [Teleopsis dalmanni]